VALGELHEPRAIPQLLVALTDANRLVRMRAAESLVDLREEVVSIFAQVVAARDRYGLHAYLAALENVSREVPLETELQNTPWLEGPEKDVLLKVLRSGKLLEEPVVARL
jgi:HEAT repeat protein